MKIIFWQNVLSMHQEALLVELSKQVDVWLIYEEEIYESRKAMGWDVPKFDGVKLVSIMNIDSVKNDLLQNLDYFQKFNLPILAGLSRKSMMYKYLDSSPEKILPETVALNLFALQQ